MIPCLVRYALLSLCTLRGKLTCKDMRVVQGNIVPDKDIGNCKRGHKYFVKLIIWVRKCSSLGCDHVEGQGVAVSQRSPALAQRVSYWLPVCPLIGWPVTKYWAPIGQTHLRILYEALGVGQAITETGEHWQHHLPGRVTEHLRYVPWCHDMSRITCHVSRCHSPLAPRLNPSLSGPRLNTGARNASRVVLLLSTKWMW